MNDFVRLKEFYRGKKVLITGHTGFKGAWLSQMLLMMGADVCGYSLEPPTSPALFCVLDLESQMRSVTGDIRDFAKLKKVFDEFEPEFVIHMAAQPIVRTSYEEPVYTYETNVMGTVHVLECIRLQKSVRSFLNVTTDKVYENKEQLCGYVEEDVLDGYDPYSNSKSCSELVTHSYRKSFLEQTGTAVSTARAGNVIGGGDFAKDRIIPDCFRAAAKKEEVILRNPHSVRPYQHVLEPLYIYLTIMMEQSQNRSLQGYYNVGPDDADCVSTSALVEDFQKEWGTGFTYRIGGDGGPHEAGFLKLNCDKLKNVFGWRPRMDIHGAVSMTTAWYKAYLQGEDMAKITRKQVEEFLCR